MDAESFGAEALSEVQILEKRVPAAVQPAMQAAMPSPSTPKPQSSPMPGFSFNFSLVLLYFKSYIQARNSKRLMIIGGVDRMRRIGLVERFERNKELSMYSVNHWPPCQSSLMINCLFHTCVNKLSFLEKLHVI